MCVCDASVAAYGCEITARLWLGYLLAVEEDCLSLCVNKSVIVVNNNRSNQNTQRVKCSKIRWESAEKEIKARWNKV